MSMTTPCESCGREAPWDVQLLYCDVKVDPVDCTRDTAINIRTAASFPTRDFCSLRWQQVAAQPLYAAPTTQYIKAKCIQESAL